MRTAVLVLLTGLALAGPAMADQTDPRLDVLFEELRTGDGSDAEGAVGRIQSIWADSQSDTVDLLVERATSAIEGDRFDLAAALLDHAIGLAPSFAQAYALRGSVRLSSDNAAGAIEDFTRAVDLETRHFDARIALAEIMLASGDKRGAYDMLQRALEWNPHEPHARNRARKLREELNGQEI
jgi:tetratricopeptide (TPR) repeat protein